MFLFTSQYSFVLIKNVLVFDVKVSKSAKIVDKFVSIGLSVNFFKNSLNWEFLGLNWIEKPEKTFLGFENGFSEKQSASQRNFWPDGPRLDLSFVSTLSPTRRSKMVQVLRISPHLSILRRIPKNWEMFLSRKHFEEGGQDDWSLTEVEDLDDKMSLLLGKSF